MRGENEGGNKMTLRSEDYQLIINRDEQTIGRFRAACRCAIASLTQPKTYEADINVAIAELTEALEKEGEIK